MIRLAFLQEKGNGRLDPEARQLRDELTRRGIPVQLFTDKRILRRRLPIAPDTLVAGYVPVVHSALQQLGASVPEPDDYPVPLRPWLRRRTWQSTVGEIEAAVYDGRFEGAFVKPSGRLKQFTGLVIDSRDDLFRLGSTSRRQPVHCSEIVSWKSEFRYFVIHGRIADARPYAGDAAVRPDDDVVRAALRALHDAGPAPAGFGIDFGVLEGGATALVEVNDGYSLGSYGLDDALYTDLLIARWEQLVTQ